MNRLKSSNNMIIDDPGFGFAGCLFSGQEFNQVSPDAKQYVL